jgi:hypothetical protein
MAQHARLRRQLRGERPPFPGERLARGRRDHRAAVRLEEVLREELQLPEQLLDVEGDAVRRVVARREFRAAALHDLDERDGLPIEAAVLGGRRGAEMRLQRDVAEIVQHEDPQIARTVEDARHRQPHRFEQAGHALRTAGGPRRTARHARRTRSTAPASAGPGSSADPRHRRSAAGRWTPCRSAPIATGMS